MKRFYSLFAAVAVCAGMSFAVTPMAKSFDSGVRMSEFKDTPVLKLQTSGQEKAQAMKAQKKNVAKAAIAPSSLDGDYLTLSAYYSEDQYVVTGPYGAYMEAEDDVVYIGDFLYGWFYDDIKELQATVNYYEDYDISTLVIPAEANIIEYGGEDFGLYYSMYAYSDYYKGYYIFTLVDENDDYSNIEFQIAEDGIYQLVGSYDRDGFSDIQYGISIIAKESGGVYAFLPDVAFVPTNGVNPHSVYYPTYDQGYSDQVPVTAYANGSAVMVYNLFGMEYPVTFSVDAANKTLTATDQFIGDLTGTYEDGTTVEIPLYYSGASYADAEKYIFDGTFDTVNEKTVVTFADYVYGINYEQQIQFYTFYDATIEFDIDLFSNSAISSVAKDSAEGEAVYYNLQGMKVANPTAGQVYIKKQGNTVTKIVR